MTEHSLLAAQLPRRREEANREHRVIYDAVEAANAVEARRAMKRHLDKVELRLRAEAGV
jgi:DNA-binding FadR family transcriptional regulator